MPIQEAINSSYVGLSPGEIPTDISQLLTSLTFLKFLKHFPPASNFAPIPVSVADVSDKNP